MSGFDEVHTSKLSGSFACQQDGFIGCVSLRSQSSPLLLPPQKTLMPLVSPPKTLLNLKGKSQVKASNYTNMLWTKLGESTKTSSKLIYFSFLRN